MTHPEPDPDAQPAPPPDEAGGVTARRFPTVEDDRQRLEARNRALINAVPDLLLVIGVDGVFRDFNCLPGRHLIVPAEAIVGSRVSDVLPPHLAEIAMRMLREALDTGRVAVAEYPVEFGDKTSYYEARAVPSGDDEALFMIRDVTERKEAERALLESQQMLRLLVDQSPMAVILWDLDARAIEWNPAAGRIFGFSKDEMRGLSATESIVPPHLNEAVRDLFSELLEQKGGYRSTNENLTKDGRTIFCEWYNTPLLDENGSTVGVASLVNDVTERVTAERKRRDMEQRMVQTQKLESLGVLAGGIAHDFNNLLVGVLGNAGLALAELPDDSSIRTAIEQIERTALRAADLTRQLLAYSGKGRFVIQPVNLTNLVGEMLELLKVSISKSATLETQLAPDLPSIEADATQIRQVIMNLLINASDALEGAAGTIRIRTALIHASSYHISRMIQSTTTLQPGHFVCLEVSDTGRGMDAETSERIFDPFFSTKQTGRGLGLAAVLGIVRGHGGALRVTSEPGEGSCFQLIFPPLWSHGESLAETPAAPLPAVHGGRVLVIDDDPTVRNVASRILQRRGYEVTCAEDGLDGLEVFGPDGSRFDLVLLDLTMPRLDGERTFAQLRERRPDVRVLITSGYDEQESTRRFSDGGIAGFVQKPFRHDDLLNAVKRALAGSPPGTAPVEQLGQ